MKPGTVVAIVAGSAALLGVVYVVLKGSKAAGDAWEGAKAAAAGAVQAVNPLNDNNVFASTANTVTDKLTGGAETSFGSWLRGATSDDDQRIADMLAGRTSDARANLRTAFNSPQPEGTW